MTPFDQFDALSALHAGNIDSQRANGNKPSWKDLAIHALDLFRQYITLFQQQIELQKESNNLSQALKDAVTRLTTAFSAFSAQQVNDPDVPGAVTAINGIAAAMEAKTTTAATTTGAGTTGAATGTTSTANF